MREEVKTAWTARLRSGQDRQVAGRLSDGVGGYCCLGVLCDMAEEAGVVDKTVGKHPFNGVGAVYYGDTDTVLPPAVMDWAGLSQDNPVTSEYQPLNADGSVAPFRYSLAELNDAGKTFSQIADVIDRDL